MSAIDVDEILEHQLNANMLSMPYDVYSELFDSIDSLGVELDKLRELVRDMCECLEHSKPLCKKCKFQELDCQWFKFSDRMRELGIEVY